MPAAKPPEFRRRAVELARRRAQSTAKIASDLGIAESCQRRWMALADTEDDRRDGLTDDELRELGELRRRNRVLEMELEIVKRASAYFAQRTSSQNELPGGPRARRRRSSCRDGLPGAEGLHLGLLRLAGPATERA